MTRRALWLLAIICLLLPLRAMAADIDLAGYRICIDPGHQARLDDRHEPVAPGSTEVKARVAGGAQGVKTYRRESAVNLEIALLMRDALEAMGAQVLLVREAEDVRISNVQRAQMANQFQADVYLRLHCNASGNPAKRGIRVYAPERSARLYYGVEKPQMLAWAQALADSIRQATGAPSGTGFASNTYSGSNWAMMPTFLVEMGYMTNEKDDLLLATEAYRQGIIQGVAAFVATMPRDVYRDHPVMRSPVMENYRSTVERVTVYAQPDVGAPVLDTVGRNYRLFVLDDLGDGWHSVQTYRRGEVGYINCATLEPCR